MAYSVAQSGQTTGTLNIGSARTPGSLMLVAVGADDGTPITAITDGGNTYASVGQADSVADSESVWLWAAHNTLSTTGTFAFTGGGTGFGACFIEIIGGAGNTVRASNTRVGTIGGTTITANAVTGVAGDLYVFIGQDMGGANAGIGVGTGFTAGVSQPGVATTNPANCIQWKTAAGGSETGTMALTNTGHNYGIVNAMFEPAALVGPTFNYNSLTSAGGTDLFRVI